MIQVEYFLFILGFIILIIGADYLVEGASSIAKKFNLSDAVIGMTIVAFGTSAPELIVNILASFNGKAELAVANVIGSNISNILLILGITAALHPIRIRRKMTKREIPIVILGCLVLLFLSNDQFINKGANLISKLDGLILLIFFVFFFFLSFKKSGDQEEEITKQKNLLVSLLEFFSGLLGLFFGGQWIVDGASSIAENFGISQAFIGLVIVAIGTSLPELATSVMAATKKKVDIAIGNVVGSNIFNTYFVLGVSSVIRPIAYEDKLNFDLLINFVVSLFLLIPLLSGSKYIKRSYGVFFLISYVAYLIVIYQRG